MRLPHKALKAALHDRIEAAAISPAIRCYRNVPSSVTYPYAVIAGVRGIVDLSAKPDLTIWNLTAEVQFWSRPEDGTDVEVLDLMDAALHAVASKYLELSGWQILSQDVTEADELGLELDELGVYDHGLMTIQFKIQDSG